MARSNTASVVAFDARPKEWSDSEALTWLRAQSGGHPANTVALGERWGWSRHRVARRLRAWVDYPGRIWVDRANQGAVYSPDGFRVQFDRGTVWERAPELPPPLPRRYRR